MKIWFTCRRFHYLETKQKETKDLKRLHAAGFFCIDHDHRENLPVTGKVKNFEFLATLYEKQQNNNVVSHSESWGRAKSLRIVIQSNTFFSIYCSK